MLPSLSYRLAFGAGLWTQGNPQLQRGSVRGIPVPLERQLHPPGPITISLMKHHSSRLGRGYSGFGSTDSQVEYRRCLDFEIANSRYGFTDYMSGTMKYLRAGGTVHLVSEHPGKPQTQCHRPQRRKAKRYYCAEAAAGTTAS